MTPHPDKPLSPRLTWALLAVGVAVFVVFAYQGMRNALREHGSDLTCYLDAGRAVLARATPYDREARFPLPYPPLFALVAVPLSLLPVGVASAVWSLLLGACLAGTAMVMRRAATGRGGPLASSDLLPIAALAAILFRVVQANLANGQVNLVVVAMCAMFLRAYERRRDAAAGFWLAFAVHTKMLPILLLGLLLARRRGAAILWTAVFGVAMALAPAVVYGTDTVAIYRDWVATAADILARHTVDGGAFTLDSDGGRTYFTLRGLLATLWPATSADDVARVGCIAAVVAAAFGADFAQRRRPADERDPTAFALWLIAGLLVAPMSEKHHLAAMVPAVALAAWRRRPGWLVFASAVFAAIMLAKWLPQGPFFFAAIAIAFAWVLRAPARAQAA